MGNGKEKKFSKTYERPRSSGKVELKPRKYFKPMAYSGKVICVAREERIRAVSRPDSPRISITGRYEDKYTDPASGVEVPSISFLINQAGNHLVCVFTPFLGSSNNSTRKKDVITWLQGDIQDDGSYYLEGLFLGDRISGNLKASDDSDMPSLTLYLKSVSRESTFNLTRYSRRHTYTANALELIDSAKVKELIQYNEWAPLPRWRVEYLEEQLQYSRIKKYLDEFFDIDNSRRSADVFLRYKVLRDLNDYIASLFYEGNKGLWHNDDLLQARKKAREILSRAIVSRAGRTLTLLEWIAHMLSRVTREGIEARGSRRLTELRENLLLNDGGGTDPSDNPPFDYKIEYTIAGLGGDVGIGIGGYYGVITITKNLKGKALWKQNYNMWVAEISGGASVGFSLGEQDSGNASTYDDWKPTDFPGWFSIVTGTAIEANAGPGVTYGGAFMSIYGNEFHPPIIIDLSGANLTFGLGATAVELSEAWGRIHTIGTGPQKVGDTHIQVRQDYAIQYQMNKFIHFCLGSALLSDSARQALRILCAEELASFSDSTSQVTIIGHTDRVDSKERNMALSALRCENTLTAIADILGEMFQIPKSRISLYGKGEIAAEQKGKPDNVPSAEDRKVEIILNSRLVLTLNG